MLAKDVIKNKLVELFQKEGWVKDLPDFFSSMKTDIIWIMVDFVKDGKYLDEAMQMAENYINDKDPGIDDVANQEILKGKEYSGIVSVRGTLAWLLQALIARLHTDYYPRLVSLVERLAKDEVHYIRQQATYPLSALTINIYARKNKDETVFDFKDEDRRRVLDLSFFMLKENRDYPRVLEYLVQVFDRLRLLSEEQAKNEINTFLFSKDGEFNPIYITEKVAPLLIYNAEYRKDANDGFQDKYFKDLLIDVISKGEPRLRSTIVWHIWKTIEDNQENYQRLKPYISHIFNGDFDFEPIGQYDILIEKVMHCSGQDGIELFKKELDYIAKSLPNIKPEPGGQIWFHNAENSIDKVAELEPGSLPKLLTIMRDIYFKNGYIGDIKRMFSAYKKAPEPLLAELSAQIQPLYEQIRNRDNRLPPW
jgi:hypothetical protein